MIRHHEVQASQHRFVMHEVRIVGQLQHIGHGLAVTAYRMPRLGLLIERFLAIHGGGRVITRHMKALDGVRALDGACERGATQQSGPATRRLLQHEFEPKAHRVHSADDLHIGRRKIWDAEQHKQLLSITTPDIICLSACFQLHISPSEAGWMPNPLIVAPLLRLSRALTPSLRTLCRATLPAYFALRPVPFYASCLCQ